jgi:hypothetical protein
MAAIIRSRLGRLGRGRPPTPEAVMTDHQPDLDAVARAILDTNNYMTLGTADADGHPWVSPVFFAAAAGYMAATAAELSGAELDRQVYPGDAGRRAGARDRAPAELLAPSLYRLYRASVTQHWVLDPGASPDQRTPVSP